MTEWNHELLGSNRRLLAERQGWPAGALEACEGLDRKHSGWSVWWRAECTVPGLEHPAGYVADRLDAGNVIVCGATVEELEDAMLAAPVTQDHWRRRDRCCARRWL